MRRQMVESAASRMADARGSSRPSGLSRAASRACATVVTATGDDEDDDEPPQALDPRTLIVELAGEKAARNGTGLSKAEVAKGRSGSKKSVIAGGTTNQSNCYIGNN